MCCGWTRAADHEPAGRAAPRPGRAAADRPPDHEPGLGGPDVPALAGRPGGRGAADAARGAAGRARRQHVGGARAVHDRPGGRRQGPAVPWLGTFPETNVRLYSIDEQGRRGVVFRSLEASRLAVVLGARAAFNLPYRWARMSIARSVVDDLELDYRTSRRFAARGARRAAGGRAGRGAGRRPRRRTASPSRRRCSCSSPPAGGCTPHCSGARSTCPTTTAPGRCTRPPCCTCRTPSSRPPACPGWSTPRPTRSSSPRACHAFFGLPHLRRAVQSRPSSPAAEGAKSPLRRAEGVLVVEPRGLEPLTPCLQSRCATNCAKAPVELSVVRPIPRAPEVGVRPGRWPRPRGPARLLPSSIFFVATRRRRRPGGRAGSSSWASSSGRTCSGDGGPNRT